MRKTFLTDEYSQKKVPGTWSLGLKKHFMASVMINIPGSITITGADDWIAPTPYVAYNGQLQHSFVTVTKDESRTGSWFFDIDTFGMLSQYAYRKMWGEYDTDDETMQLSPLARFISQEAILNYTVPEAAMAFVKSNVSSQYKLSGVKMYAKYYDLVTTSVLEPPYGSIPLLKNSPTPSRLARTGALERIVLNQTSIGKYRVSLLQSGNVDTSIFLYDFDYVFTRI